MRIPKDLLYGEQAKCSLPVGRFRLRYKDICERYKKLSDIDVNKWQGYAGDRANWRTAVREDLMRAEERRRLAGGQEKETEVAGNIVLVVN